MHIKSFFNKILVKLGIIKPIFYINGPETLPPPLTLEEERKLLEAADTASREKLIVHNLRLVVYIARKFEINGAGIEDLISIGTIGLIKAVNTFCVDKNIKLGLLSRENGYIHLTDRGFDFANTVMEEFI